MHGHVIEHVSDRHVSDRHVLARQVPEHVIAGHLLGHVLGLKKIKVQKKKLLVFFC